MSALFPPCILAMAKRLVPSNLLAYQGVRMVKALHTMTPQLNTAGRGHMHRDIPSQAGQLSDKEGAAALPPHRKHAAIQAHNRHFQAIDNHTVSTPGVTSISFRQQATNKPQVPFRVWWGTSHTLPWAYPGSKQIAKSLLSVCGSPLTVLRLVHGRCPTPNEVGHGVTDVK